MMTKEELLQTLSRLKNELRNRFGIEQIGLFGSYARGEATEKSDIDLVILKMEKKDFSKRVAAIEFLERHLNKKVDMGYLDSMKTFVKNRIEKEIIRV